VNWTLQPLTSRPTTISTYGPAASKEKLKTTINLFGNVLAAGSEHGSDRRSAGLRQTCQNLGRFEWQEADASLHAISCDGVTLFFLEVAALDHAIELETDRLMSEQQFLSLPFTSRHHTTFLYVLVAVVSLTQTDDCLPGLL
jgi:hypothetical protein